MTDDDREIRYLTQERIGILTDGRREATEHELSMAHLEAVSIVMRRKSTQTKEANGTNH